MDHIRQKEMARHLAFIITIIICLTFQGYNWQIKLIFTYSPSTLNSTFSTKLTLSHVVDNLIQSVASLTRSTPSSIHGVDVAFSPQLSQLFNSDLIQLHLRGAMYTDDGIRTRRGIIIAFYQHSRDFWRASSTIVAEQDEDDVSLIQC